VPERRTRIELIVFCMGTFAPVLALSIVANGWPSLIGVGGVAPLAMLTPALSALVVHKFITRSRIFGNSPFGIRIGNIGWWALGAIFFALYAVCSVLISTVVAPDLLVDHAGFVQNVSRLRGVPPILPAPSGTFALAIAMSFFIGSILNLPIFLGEELGWRGFMNPRLLAIYGRYGLILGGVVWALWHIPLILLGLNYPDHPVIGIAVWIPICVCLNVLLQAVKERARSIFASALAHGAMNQLAPLLMSVLFVKSRFVDYLHGPAGLIGLGVLAVPAVHIFRNWDRFGKVSETQPLRRE
jgi:membrane protease YdiL (CAAX protease family)